MAQQKACRGTRSKFSRKGKGPVVEPKSEFNLEVSFSAERAVISNTSCITPSSSLGNLNRRVDLSSMNVYGKLRVQSNVFQENPQKKIKTFEDPSESIMYDGHVRGLESSMECGNSGFGLVNHLYVGTSSNRHSMVDSSATEELEQEKNSVKKVIYARRRTGFNGQMEDDDSEKIVRKLSSVKKKSTYARSKAEFNCQMEEDGSREVVRKPERRCTSRNIDAERKRRTKLKESLYALRALVPKITKMDRAAIIGDAIDFVAELQNQVKELQNELEALELEGEMNIAKSSISNIQVELPLQNVVCREAKKEKSDSLDGMGIGIRRSFESNEVPDYSSMEDKIKRKIVVTVEVTQIDANKFFFNVVCEHNRHGFLRLMEVMNSLGLEIANANITTCKGLVSNVLQVEMVDSETFEADQLRDLLAMLLQNAMSE
ncbi:hypothetical protein Scep_024240 [Stephania cephalantha]|uniref:BHLH domain-containing protein n=1 Tax=Stephania cephalantha TaxID=152367 RepID=A0AAP0EW67_9MAGN